jgi:hypothetical protein
MLHALPHRVDQALLGNHRVDVALDLHGPPIPQGDPKPRRPGRQEVRAGLVQELPLVSPWSSLDRRSEDGPHLGLGHPCPDRADRRWPDAGRQTRKRPVAAGESAEGKPYQECEAEVPALGPRHVGAQGRPQAGESQPDEHERERKLATLRLEHEPRDADQTRKDPDTSPKPRRDPGAITLPITHGRRGLARYDPTRAAWSRRAGSTVSIARRIWPMGSQLAKRRMGSVQPASTKAARRSTTSPGVPVTSRQRR